MRPGVLFQATFVQSSSRLVWLPCLHWHVCTVWLAGDPKHARSSTIRLSSAFASVWRQIGRENDASCCPSVAPAVLCKEARHARKITWSVWLRDGTVVGLVGLYPLALPLLFEMRLCPALLCRRIIWRSQIKGNHHEVKYRPSMRFFPWLWCRRQQVQTLLIFISSFFVTCCWNVNTGELSISTLNALHRSSRPQALLEH